jgi:hypothetical protein
MAPTRATRATPLVAALLLASASSASAAFICTQADTTCASLGDFYTALGGPNWTNSSTVNAAGAILTSTANWDKAASGVATDYCTFFGVTCATTATATATALKGSILKLCAPPTATRLSCLLPCARAPGCCIPACTTAATEH